MKAKYIILIVIALTIIFGSLYVFRKPATPLPEIHGVYLDKPKPLIAVALEDMNGQPFGDYNFLGHFSLVFFGFTSCPDICPTTLSLLNHVSEKIYAMPGVPMPQIVFVSVDPERDTPERLKQYVTHFNKDFIGVTGNHEQLTNFSRQLGVIYEKVTLNEDGSEYTIDHSGSIALINRRGAIIAYFTPPLNAENIANDYAKIVAISPCSPT